MIIRDDIVDLLNRPSKMQFPNDTDEKDEKPVVQHYLD